MDKWEYKLVPVEYVEYEKMPMNWKLYTVHEHNGEVSTVMREVAEELNILGDDGWEIVGVVPGGSMVPVQLGPDGKPLTFGVPGATVGPRAGGLLILKRPKL